MAIGLFIDGAYVSNVFAGRIDYLALRTMLEQELADVVDEAYYFNADDDPPKAQKLQRAGVSAANWARPASEDLLASQEEALVAQGTRWRSCRAS